MNTAYKPSADEIKRLREESGAGMSDVRNALLWAEGDFERARARLGDLGQAKAEKKAERAANEGLVGSYIHAGGKIGVLVEINCETDFVARNERFRDLVRDVAMHVAAMSPQYADLKICLRQRGLLEQPFVKDDAQTVGELVNSVSGVLGEKIRVRRYVKFALGEE